MSTSYCPIAQEESNGDDEEKHLLVKRIPQRWLDFGLINFLKFLSTRQNIFRERMQEYGSTVYKIKFDETWIILCDHVAMKSIFDPTKVNKDPGLGLGMYNTILTKGYIPCLLDNEESHGRKKKFLMDFIDEIFKKTSIVDIMELVKFEFEKMESIEFTDHKIAESFQFEKILNTAVKNVLWRIMFDEYPDDSMPVFEWIDRMLVLKPSLFFKKIFSREDVVATKMFDMVKSMKKIKEMTSIIEGEDRENTIHEIILTTHAAVVAAVDTVVISSLAAFLRLCIHDQELLKSDGDTFFASSNYEDTFPTLTNIHSFVMEVMRLHPGVPQIFGRAKKDFVLQSTSGYYQVRKNEFLCACVYLAHEDAKLFENPDTFMLTRPITDMKMHNTTFGGFFHNPSTSDNHKCPGVHLAMKVIPMFILFLTRCICVPTKVPVDTGLNIKARDDEIRVLKFHYEK